MFALSAIMNYLAVRPNFNTKPPGLHLIALFGQIRSPRSKSQEEKALLRYEARLILNNPLISLFLY